MKKMIMLGLLAIFATSGAVLLGQHASSSKQETEFTFEMLTKGNLENLVSSTGTLSAVGTVEIGSQTSGTLQKVLVDYNDHVKKGQLLAVVDTTLLEASVREAEASLAKTQAELAQAQTEFQRKQKLFQEGYLSELDFLTVKTKVETATASTKSAKAVVTRNQTNLQYAEIRSPINGTVIQRSVEAGQTIAASLNAPTLFSIAEDLANMQIEASVDESDIGQIRENMRVRFTVHTYPDKTFTGVVRQIRLQPTTVQDVVNYTVVVAAANAEGLLLPGMTATVDFVVEERQDVLLIPNTALFFQPSQEVLAAMKNQQSGTSRRADGAQAAKGASREANAETKLTRVFYLDEAGQPQMTHFLPGTSDGQMTEILESRQLQEGLRVITGVSSAKTASAQKSLLSNRNAGMQGPPPMF